MTELQIQQETKEIKRRYAEILRVSYQTLNEEDKKLIRKAFEVALDAHKDQRRKSGEPYIYHPLAVAQIVASEIGLGAVAISAALLHDVVEDTDYTLEDMERLFGTRIAKIIDGLTKISGISDSNVSMQAENFRKMLLTLSDDVRVILIKLADRLNNMQTLDAMPRHKQLKIASETLYIYAPLAHRLGLYNIKTELEDLGLKYTEPEVYHDIQNKLNESKEEQENYIEEFVDKINDALKNEGIDFAVIGRPKSIFSIRKKMMRQGVSFEEVYDRFAIRIIYKSDMKDEKFNAWKIYSVVTDHFQPNPARLRDWLSAPKSTGYEALHVTVIGPKGRWVEVQIRSERMNEIAEKGYAAHYKYKHGNSNDNYLDHWINKIKETLENPDVNAVEFVDEFKLNLYAKEIFVFTPKGDLRSLPKGATALDFAFEIHSDVGASCLGAKVNGKIVPLDYLLRSGDRIEILTGRNQKPKIDWLDFVQTAKAKARIKAALREEKKKIADEGKEVLQRKLRHLKVDLNEKVVSEMCNYFKLQTSLELFYRIGTGEIDNSGIKEFVAHRSGGIYNFFRNRMRRKTPKPAPIQEEETPNYDSIVFGPEEEQLEYQMANCCNPIAGDPIFGFITVSDGIKIHRKDCPNAIGLQSNFAYRIIRAKWVDSKRENYNITLSITGIDNVGLVSEITHIISDNMHVNIRSINIGSDAGTFEGKIALVVQNQNQLQKLINRLKKVNGIKSVKREN